MSRDLCPGLYSRHSVQTRGPGLACQLLALQVAPWVSSPLLLDQAWVAHGESPADLLPGGPPQGPNLWLNPPLQAAVLGLPWSFGELGDRT